MRVPGRRIGAHRPGRAGRDGGRADRGLAIDPVGQTSEGERVAVTMELVPEPAFPEAEFRLRLAGLEERIAGSGFDALLIHTPENITYVSGWHTPGYYYPQFVLVRPGADPIIVLRGLEALGLPVRSWFRVDQLITFSDTDDPLESLLEGLQRLGLSGRAIGIEKTGWFLSIDFYERLRARMPSARFADGSGIVESMRKVKSPAEVERIREACRLAEVGIQAAIDHCTPGVTEAALAGQVHRAMVEEGCEYTGLPVFVMSGHRQLAPHSVWSREKRIVPGENVFVEVRRGPSTAMRGRSFERSSSGPRRGATARTWPLRRQCSRRQWRRSVRVPPRTT